MDFEAMKKLIIAIFALVVSMSAHAADPVKIMKSRIGPTFEAEVTAYARDLADWKAHMAQVEADKAARIPKERASAPFPAPTVPPQVAAALDESGKPNYQIVDDGPTADDILIAKKRTLLTEVRMAEGEAIARVVPIGKVRAFGARQNQIAAADAKKEADLLAAQPVGVLSAVGVGARKNPAKAHADAIKARAPADAQFLQDQADREAKRRAIEAVAIQMESDIEDLTAGNIDAWKMTPFPN
jgi:hypothetical protein